MITCMPIRIWMSTEISAAKRIIATNGLESVAITLAWLDPTRLIITARNATMSGRFAMPVSRCIQKCPVPEWAVPNPCTRENGVFIGAPSTSEHVAEYPNHERQHGRADNRRVGEELSLAGLETVHRVPDKMANAAEHVMQQRPSVAEQHELSEPGR